MSLLSFATFGISGSSSKHIMKIESFGVTDVGCKREKNEDSFLVNDELQLYVVADGMGGHVGGECASRLAVKTVEEVIEKLNADPDATLQEGYDIKPGDYKGWLNYAFSMASSRIFDKAAEDNTLHGMGTTTVALFFRNNRIFVANVGDSRAYRIRTNKIEQLTTDHSLVAEQIRAGILKPKEAKEHRFKNIITRSVGFQEGVEVDIEARGIKGNDVYLLCSDGLYNLVSNEEMLDLVKNNSLKDSCKHLIDIANARGGDDNISVILVRVDSLDDNLEEDEESTMQA